MVDQTAKAMSKEKNKLVKKHVKHINKVATTDNIPDGPYSAQQSLAKSIEWSTLINAMSQEVHKRARKLSPTEVEQTVRGAIDMVTANRADELVPNDVFMSTVTMALSLQDEAWKTRCWGGCGKKTVE